MSRHAVLIVLLLVLTLLLITTTTTTTTTTTIVSVDAFQFPVAASTTTIALQGTIIPTSINWRSGMHLVPITSSTATSTSTTTQLNAKNTNKNKKRVGGPRGGGRRGKAKRDGIPEEDNSDDDEYDNSNEALLKPSKFRKRIIELDRRTSSRSSTQQQQHPIQQQQNQQKQKQQQVVILPPPVRVCAIEIDDVEWWEHKDNDNPFGARLWPSALAISEFLVSGMGGSDNDNDSSDSSRNQLAEYDVLELGCGVGLVSIVAAECGANVVATDISPTVLKLCHTGWKETQLLHQQDEEKALTNQRETQQKLQRRMRQLNTMMAATEMTEEKRQNLQRMRQLNNDLLATTTTATNQEGEAHNKLRGGRRGRLETQILDMFADEPLPLLSNTTTVITKEQQALMIKREKKRQRVQVRQRTNNGVDTTDTDTATDDTVEEESSPPATSHQEEEHEEEHQSESVGQLQRENTDVVGVSEEASSSSLPVITTASSSSSNKNVTSTSTLSQEKKSTTTKKKMLIATAMMYDAGLATALAHKAMEALIESDAWVIIGDGDEGNRENGRNVFLRELERLEKQQHVSFHRTWTTSIVKNKALNWNEKIVKILQLNAPLQIEFGSR